jgi:hypothetical protein
LTDWLVQIGFLTEWQLYAQKIEGDAWAGEKLDQGKLQKMSGTVFSFYVPCFWCERFGNAVLTGRE